MTDKLEFAKNPSTPSEALFRLASDKDADVRRFVALNSSTPVEVLIKLSSDEDADVRARVALNQNTPVEALIKLSSDENEVVRARVASNRNTPVELLTRLEDFLRYFRMFVTGSNFKDILKNLATQDFLCGTNKELFVDIQSYLYEFYSDFHGEVWDEIDSYMYKMKIPDSLREKFEMWYSELYIEDDFEFLQSCFLSDNPEEFFGYGILYEIADKDVGIKDWDPQETAQLKSILEHWICSQSRKDFLEEVADRHVDALNDLSRKYNAL